MFVLTFGHTLQCSSGFTLATSTDDQHLIIRYIGHLVHWQNRTFRDFEYALTHSNLGVAHHATTIERYAPSSFDSGINGHLNTVHITRKECHEYPALGAAYNIMKAFLEGALCRCSPEQ